MSYELPPSNIAGARRRLPVPTADPALHVDYADVLEQAKINEREKVLRELYSEVSSVSTDRGRSYDYRSDPKRPDEIKSEILALIRRKQS